MLCELLSPLMFTACLVSYSTSVTKLLNATLLTALKLLAGMFFHPQNSCDYYFYKTSSARQRWRRQVSSLSVCSCRLLSVRLLTGKLSSRKMIISEPELVDSKARTRILCLKAPVLSVSLVTWGGAYNYWWSLCILENLRVILHGP